MLNLHANLSLFAHPLSPAVTGAAFSIHACAPLCQSQCVTFLQAMCKENPSSVRWPSPLHTLACLTQCLLCRYVLSSLPVLQQSRLCQHTVLLVPAGPRLPGYAIINRQSRNTNVHARGITIHCGGCESRADEHR